MTSRVLVQKAAFCVHVAARMRQLRKDRGLTQQAFADTVGIDRSELSRYETADQLPSLVMFARICNAFDVSPDYFLKVSA